MHTAHGSTVDVFAAAEQLTVDEARRRVPTTRQRNVLLYIHSSIEARGYPPTLREIGKQFGISSTNGVSDHLHALERKGLIHRQDMLSRGIRLTPAAHALCGHVAVDEGSPLVDQNLRMRSLLARVVHTLTELSGTKAPLVVDIERELAR